MKIYTIIITILFVVSLVWIGFGSRAPDQVAVSPEADAFPQGWQVYTDPEGNYSFPFPPETKIIPSDDGKDIAILPIISGLEFTAPDMVIKINSFDVEFHAWEDFQPSYFSDVVSGFQHK